MKEIISLHRQEYGVDPECVVSAPGIVNLIGSHTSYNEGYTLSIGIDRFVYVAMSKRDDNSFKFYSVNLKERKKTTIYNLRYKKEDRWANYIKGMLYAFSQKGCQLKGLDITIFSTVPLGIGLSASSALQIACGVAINTLLHFEMSEIQIIEASHVTESKFIGVDYGIDNQMVSFMTKEDTAMFIDARTLEYEHIPFSLDDTVILITDSQVSPASHEGEFQECVDDCRQCVDVLKKRKSGSALRDYTIEDLEDSMGVISEGARRRCIHVIEENQRVLQFKEQLEQKDWSALGKFINRSHESLRDLYEISCPEIDWLVKRGQETEGVFGGRITGLGFGGSTVTILREDAIEAYKSHFEEYERIFGFSAESFTCKPAGGVKILFPEGE